MQVASLTLAAINAAIERDQGATFRGHLRALIPLAEDAFNDKEEYFRSHLGASLIGRKCSREIWYGFNWAKRSIFNSQMLRLFNRGHLEEPRFVAMLKTIGCEVWQFDEAGRQYRITGHGGHSGGGLDAVIRGIPEMPETTVLGEFKTHNDKSFTTLVKNGVLSAKWEHFVQMQRYMGFHKLTHALYMAVNKDNDMLHAEIIQYDPGVDSRYAERTSMIIGSVTPPPRISESPGWYECKFCSFKDICHRGELPEKNCRTCSSSSLLDAGKRWCSKNGGELSKDDQLAGCGMYEVKPIFIQKKK